MYLMMQKKKILNRKLFKPQLVLNELKEWLSDEHLRIEGIKLLLQQDGMEIRSYKSYLKAIDNVTKFLKRMTGEQIE